MELIKSALRKLYKKSLCHKVGMLLPVLTFCVYGSGYAQDSDWPILKSFDGDHIKAIAMPIGGIGTGTVSLGGRGNLQDWEIMNRPAKGFTPGTSHPEMRTPFFAVYVKEADKKSKVKLLEGPFDEGSYDDWMGSLASSAGLPRFANATFDAAYPMGRVNLQDDGMPIKVNIKAFNPLIPGNVDDSSIPMAVISFDLTNTTESSIETAVCGSLKNFIGNDGKNKNAKQNRNKFLKGDGYHSVFMHTNGVEKGNESWGTIAMSLINESNVTYRTHWEKESWGNALLDYWDDFSDDGKLEERQDNGEDMPMGSLATSFTIPPNTTKTVTYLISWHFPNRFGWSETSIGNYYTTRYSDALDVVVKELPRLSLLKEKTTAFVNAIINSDLPFEVREAALSNAANLRTQTVFRGKTGHLFGWEGSQNNQGACWGSCTHVWNYDLTTPYLFGALAQTMREVEFKYATDDRGLMSFRVGLPLSEKAQSFGKAAADGQMGTIMKVYREWQLSGDDTMLKTLWPKIKKAMAFAWIKGGWDGDQDGVMEGVQHNTMDVEYLGPNPQMQFWYLGALKASENMASYLGEKTFSIKCGKLFAKGSRWVDENLFNGEYYQQKIVIPDSSNIAPELIVGMGAKDFNNPAFQLGEGCLVDQLIGQMMSHVCGLGYLGKPENIQKTLQSIMKYNYRDHLNDHFNALRTYASGDDAALLMASYPYKRPKYPFPYFTEVMTGFEYTAAMGMLYEGQEDIGLKAIRAVRSRYDGKKRSPFNEIEYGHHYARAMISWGGILAMTGFQYSAVDKSMQFNNRPGVYFWSNGHQYGTVQIGKEGQVELKLLNGGITIRQFTLRGRGTYKNRKGKTISEGESFIFLVPENNPKAGLPKLYNK